MRSINSRSSRNGCHWNRLMASTAMLFCVFISSSLMADSRDQAKRIHDRLTGISPSNSVLQTMSDLIDDDSVRGPFNAAQEAMNNSAFYNATLKNFAAPWTNEDQTLFVPLNDYSGPVHQRKRNAN